MPSFLFRLMRVLAVVLFAAGVALWLFVSKEKPQKKEMVNTEVSKPPHFLCSRFGTCIRMQSMNAQSNR